MANLTTYEDFFLSYRKRVKYFARSGDDTIFLAYLGQDIIAQDTIAQLASSPDSEDRRYGKKTGTHKAARR
jgi:hypothetical protein